MNCLRHLLVFSACAAVLAAAETPSTALLVLNKKENTLAIVDPATLKVVAKVPTGATPHEVAASPDGKFAFVSNYGPHGDGNSISVIDLVAQKETRVDLGDLHGIHGIAAWDDKAIFAAERAGLLGRYDPAERKVDWKIELNQGAPHMVVINSDASLMATSNMRSDTISILERAPGGAAWTQAVVAVGKRPEAIEISPDGKEIWTATFGDSAVSIIDIAARKVKQTFDSHTQRANRLRITPDGKYALLSDLAAGELVIFNAPGRKEIKRLKLGTDVEGILIEPSGKRAFVAITADDRVAVLDLHTLNIATRFSPGPGTNPDGMAWAVRR